MKCLVIHGSPRRGNTWDVLTLVKEEMRKNGNVEFIDIELRKEKIPSCIGCFNCIVKGEEKCPSKDIISNITTEIEKADGLIITSPVYSLQVTGLLKDFIDHMSYNFHRPRFFTKKALVITTTAGAGHVDTANYIKKVLYYWGFNSVNTLPIAYRAPELNQKNRDKVIKGAKSFMENLTSNKLKSPNIKRVAMFNVWRGMSKEEKGFGNADYNYWNDTGLSKYPFSPDVEVNIFKKIVGNLIYKIIN